jgi:hypothetical protein
VWSYKPLMGMVAGMNGVKEIYHGISSFVVLLSSHKHFMSSFEAVIALKRATPLRRTVVRGSQFKLK